MLGFSPLASAPLGDSGEQLDSSNLIRIQPIILGKRLLELSLLKKSLQQ
jgi:hypothetical protein